MLTEFVDVSAAFGLSVNMVKTLFMAVGHGITDCDRAPLSIHDAQVQHASRFSYLGSIVTPDGHSHADVRNRVAAASRAFGALYTSVFRNATLSTEIKHSLYLLCLVRPAVWVRVLDSTASRCALFRALPQPLHPYCSGHYPYATLSSSSLA